MFHIDNQYLTAVILVMLLAGPPLWWAGEALAEARNQPIEIAANTSGDAAVR